MIGIGGIGVSALARLYRSRGFQVSGSDIARSEITDALSKKGIRVHIGPHHSLNLLAKTSRVVYSVAVKPNNPELRQAERRRIPCLTYAEAVGELTREFRTIAVAGAHGKSTTTALIGLMLAKAGLDPTVIVGAKLHEFKDSNFRAGRSSWLVLEADEYRASFLNYAPAVAVVTNIDREHLDFYKTVSRIEKAFLTFLTRIKPNGAAVLNRDDHRLRRIGLRLARARPDVRITWYSIRSPATRKIKSAIRIPGQHNIRNALAAYAAARLCQAKLGTALAAIRAYRGAWRRFDYQGLFAGARVFADYAHHPTEIRATLQAAKELLNQRAARQIPLRPLIYNFPRPRKNVYYEETHHRRWRENTEQHDMDSPRLWCVFQPHHYERTRDLFPEFVKAFDGCDALILLDIYEVAGRERHRHSPAVSSIALARAIRRRGLPALYLPEPRRLAAFLRRWLRPGDVLLMMGAGSIWEMTKRLMASSKRKTQN
jgi:UDP-N-acetylmuramate--alanine ligase